MGYLKFSPNLFLGKQELQKFKEFLDDQGFRRLFLQSVAAFGVVANPNGGNASNFLVTGGSSVGTVKIGSGGYAVDVNGQLITLAATDNIAIPNDSQWYWMRISYATSANEQGTFALDSSGNLTGVGSALTESLRGMPNIPSRVKFTNSLLNTGEYDVNSVTNDAYATLSGSFVPETGLTMAVVGSFAPDYVPLSTEKQIFQYDACGLTLVRETVFNMAPTLVEDQQFWIARVQRVGATVTIQDKRNLNLYRTAESSSDLFGFERVRLSNTVPNNVIDFVVGTRNQNVMITQDIDVDDSLSGTSFILTQDQFINLHTDTPPINGNSFIIQINGSYVRSGGKTIKIVQNYVSSSNIGTILYVITDNDIIQANANNLTFRCVYDAANAFWIVSRFVSNVSTSISTKVVPIGTWNMDTTVTVNVPHGLSDSSKIRGIDVAIAPDGGTPNINLCSNDATGTGVVNGGINNWSSVNIVLVRTTGALFDNAGYATTPTINGVVTRGFVTIRYEG
jgi:hypothetical protein